MELLNNIVVVPEYSSNSGLVRQVLSSLSEYIDDSVYSRRERDLKIIVFRPTGRPADEFGEAVLPLLKGFNGWVYLLVAFSGQYKNITDLVPDSEKSKVRCMEAIYIQSGQLLPEGSPNYSANKTAMEKTAIQIAQDYGLVTKKTVISLEIVSTFVACLRDRPELIEQQLIDVIEEEFRKPGQLLKILESLSKGHTQPIIENRLSQKSLNCQSFLEIMDKPMELDENLKAAIQHYLKMSEKELIEGLKRVVKRIKDRRIQHV